jgi:diacylglycerol kinase (ATP)
MTPVKNTGIIRIIKAFGYSMAGLRAAFVSEAAFRQELALAVVMIPLALWVEVSPAERALLLVSVFLVLIVELLNSAIEAIVDRVGTEHHELSGKAKDIGSAAVFVALVLVAVVWAVILLPQFV